MGQQVQRRLGRALAPRAAQEIRHHIIGAADVTDLFKVELAQELAQAH